MNQIKFEYGCFYHIFNRGNNLENLFIEQRNYNLFLDLMKKYLLQVADVYAYCLMKNHFYLLIKIKEKEEIADRNMQEKPFLGFSHFLNSYTQKFNKTYNRKGSLFQEGLKRMLVTDKNYFVQLVAYIHLNPIKHKFYDSLNYPYSSYNAMISKGKTLLKRDELMRLFGNFDNFIAWHDERKILREILLTLEE